MSDDPKRAKTRRKRFNAVHVKGLEALRAGDLDAFGKAIEKERAIIEEQAVDIARVKRKLKLP